ncbi:FAD-dependent oxidoreductase [Varunaivibrio sulfuroxidans]|uniref:Pyridine nucleotide-disulfide oxidoreductase n=1 Tax=Varunaivibrio sulfuroxidans TaxID=1773489 RepID=A0A4R3J5N5_9PROT|nr:FAD-dependent oxidoreductase [Varunaivibrio sulfuroxidans]TCS60637.1 pyridine nucleotide-disulfide oxidoreductase [Varunaivibrio sulfuroxidans]WES30126.1 FAD-dependent oxidoreductase [Varunaivibrio sulfuroxidans]
MTDLALAHGLEFSALYDRAGLHAIDALFLDHLKQGDPDLHGALLDARKNPADLTAKDTADLLVAVGPHLDDFIAELFAIAPEVRALAARHHELAPLYACKRLFVQRRAAKAVPADALPDIDGTALERTLAEKIGGPLTQLSFAKMVMGWLDDEAANAENLALAARYAAWAMQTPAGRARHGDDIVFRAPAKTNFDHLVETAARDLNGVPAMAGPDEHIHDRPGFALTDPGCDLTGALDEANYCVICHERGKDSCAKGLKDKKTGAFTVNPLGITLAGCPLEERISEMHKTKAAGHAIAALALITLDNPLCAGTGHRICNDCMKACIYQKQDPVDIPQVETRTLKDVLDLPWGFEIYSLLTRWNPLNLARPVPKDDSGYKVLVVGAGPAGVTLSHHLINEGHAVIAIDGAKLEPLDPQLGGVTPLGARVPFAPIRDIADIREPLDDRIMAGFGGVAEYGITVRWDKNFLKIMRLLVERRERFTLIGGVRFGAQITKESAFAMGFDHIALCMGAGKPTVLGIPNGLARGVRQASDFLMALQLTGAAKMNSLANLQVRLPVVVIGGGLTAIDTATEALAYYVAQVEKFKNRYDTLVADLGEEGVRQGWSAEETAVAEDFLRHGAAIAEERAAAAHESRSTRIHALLDAWGGATIAYRRRMTASPSYTLNHEEIEKALEQGIRFAELLSPSAVEIDAHGYARALKLARQEIGEDGRPRPSGETVVLPARTILIAAGTQPNTVLAREDDRFARLDGKFFQAVGEDGQPVTPERSAKPDAVEVLMEVRDDGRAMSFFGDLHPSFAGNVVKAMASAKQGFPVVDTVLRKRPVEGPGPEDLARRLNDGLRARVVRVERLTPNIVEVVVKAPMAAAAFKPGQFFRLQNFEVLADVKNSTHMAMEGLALTGAWVDVDNGLVSLIVLEMGGSSSLCQDLKPDEPVVLMGPTGTPTETPGGETVLLAGGGLGNAVLFSIGQALRKAGSKVLYFAGYKSPDDRYHVPNIEAAADAIVWCADTAPGFTPNPDRPQDTAFTGNIVAAMAAYAKGELGAQPIPMGDVDRLVAIGSDRMMQAVAQARHGVLKPYLKADHVAIGSINSPMQCMMKEICAQCLQLHKDPETGEETVVFSCFNQDQNLDRVDFPSLHQRLGLNGVQEKLTAKWIAKCRTS